MEQRRPRRWPWSGRRLLGGTPVPPEARRLRAGDGIDEAAIEATDAGEPGGGADIARDVGDLDDPFDGERGRQG